MAINDPYAYNADSLAPTTDKLLHYSASYALAFTAPALLTHFEMPRGKAMLYSGIGVLALGLTKELFLDSAFSWQDLLYDALGIATSSLLVFSFDLFPPPPPPPDALAPTTEPRIRYR